MGCASSRSHPPRQQLPGTPQRTSGPARCKLVLLGDSGVGKSCIVQRQCQGTFNPASAATVGAAFTAHTLALPSGVPVKFEIWDTAGQERYASLAPLYYRGAGAAAVVYDVGSERSLQRAAYWASELRRNAAGSPLLVLVGNKSDLPPAERAVGSEDAQQLADRCGMLHLETSASTGSNVGHLFHLIAEHVAAQLNPAAMPA